MLYSNNCGQNYANRPKNQSYRCFFCPILGLICLIFNSFERMKAAISNYFRAKRFGFFKALLDGMLQTQKKVKILDIGGTEDYWKNQGLVLGDQIEIVLLNLYKAEVSALGFTSIKGDATNLEGIADKSFDLVYSNSVIEHLFSLEQPIQPKQRHQYLDQRLQLLTVIAGDVILQSSLIALKAYLDASDQSTKLQLRG